MTDTATGGTTDHGPIPVADHLARILEVIEPLPAFPQTLLEAAGLPIAEDVHAEVSLPPFDNSAMDGYAVHLDDVRGASEESPVTLPVVGEIGAGQANLLALSTSVAAKIMTGAPIPRGADAVVPYEWTDRGVARVVIRKAPEPGQHIRRAGEDVTRGDLLIRSGTVLGPRQLGLLASVGRRTVLARPRPRVVVLSTGSELRDPGTELGHDSIYDGNSYLLAAAAQAAGATAYRVGIVPDQPAAFLDALRDQLVRADLVVTSGGVSQGDYDVVKEALAPLGTVWFGGVRMQPGKPQGFGFVGDRTPIFTLPGNPVSAYISFQTFVLPGLRRLMGREPEIRPTVDAELLEPIGRSPAGRQQYARGRWSEDGTVVPVGGHGSHLMGGLAESNALIVVPEEATEVPAGSTVQVLRLDVDF